MSKVATPCRLCEPKICFILFYFFNVCVFAYCGHFLSMESHTACHPVCASPATHRVFEVRPRCSLLLLLLLSHFSRLESEIRESINTRFS